MKSEQRSEKNKLRSGTQQLVLNWTPNFIYVLPNFRRVYTLMDFTPIYPLAHLSFDASIL